MSEWAISNLRRAVRHAHELEKERDRSHEFLHRLINVQEEERKKLAGDLHDRVGGRFFSICQGLDECIRKTKDDDAVCQRLNSLRSELVACTSYVRYFMNELWPTVLDELGLYEAISEYVASQRDVVPFNISTTLDPALRGWRSIEDAMLFRLAQEALLNARKHSRAKSVVINLQKSDGRVIFSVEDDGCGFDTSVAPLAGHFGLLMMRERAQVSGGVLSIESKPGYGTTLAVLFDDHD